jgi:3-oxoacyl-[acyl-carrier-protein] synthase-1
MKWSKTLWPDSGEAPSCPSRLPEGAVPATDIRIVALGLSCLSGDQPFALLGAVGAFLSGALPSSSLTAAASGQGDESPVLRAAIPELKGLDTPGDRITCLAEAALDQALSALSEGTDWSRVLVLTLLPPASSPRGRALETSTLEEALRTLHPGLMKASFCFAEAEEGAVAHLKEIGQALARGRWEAVLFGGADSLVDVVTCGTLIGEGRIATVAAAGLLPGEGAAYLLLQGGGAGAPGRARIAGSEHAPEPHPGEADSRPMTGLHAAIEAALAEGKRAVSDLAVVVLPLGAETSGPLEWHQVTQRLWPPSSAPVVRPEELHPSLVLGELGAAAFPVALVLGCARLDFRYPAAGTILVCEAGDHPQRGAVLLTL